MITLTEGPLSKFCKDGKYSDLFLMALRQYGMLCIGLYRHVLFNKSFGQFDSQMFKSGYEMTPSWLRPPPRDTWSPRLQATSSCCHQIRWALQQGNKSESLIFFSRFMSFSNLTQEPSTHLIGWIKVNRLKGLDSILILFAWTRFEAARSAHHCF